MKPHDEARSDDRLRRDLGCTEKNPVPCQDGKCKPTFVHCLRDVYEMQLLGKPLPSVVGTEDKSKKPDVAFEKTRKRRRKSNRGKDKMKKPEKAHKSKVLRIEEDN